MASQGYLQKHKQLQAREESKSIISVQTNAKSNKSSATNAISNQRDLDKMDILEKMKLNEEKHRQLMFENQKRRKQQEKKVKQQEEDKRSNEVKLLGQRKKDKEEAYVKYLRKNSKNVFENLKKQAVNQKDVSQTSYPKETVKPIQKQQAQTSYKSNYNAFDALNVETTKRNPQDKGQLRSEFEKSWAQDEEFEIMRKSELLDSLDLEVKQQVKKKKVYDKIEELIGYEEGVSEDEEDDLWNQTLKNGKVEQKKIVVEEVKPNWATKEMNIADDVLSKVSQKKDIKQPQAQTQEIKKQENKIEKTLTNIIPTQNRKPQLQKEKEKEKPPRRQNHSQPRKKSPTNTAGTRDMDIDVKEFLKEDMMHINQEEIQVQKEIQQYNQKNQQRIQEVNQKYNLRTNLVSSQQVRNPNYNPKNNQVTEESIEASLFRINNILQQPSKQPQSQTQLQFQQPQQQTTQQNPKLQVANILQQPPQQQIIQQSRQQQQAPLQPYQQQPQVDIKTIQQAKQIMVQQQAQLGQGIAQQMQGQQQFLHQQPQQIPQQQYQMLQQPQQNQPYYPQLLQMPQFIFHQDHQSFQQTIQQSQDYQYEPQQQKQQQHIYHAQSDSNDLFQKQVKQQPQKYNFNIEDNKLNQDAVDQVANLIQQNPQILEKLGYKQKDNEQEITSKDDDILDSASQQQFGESRAFKISKRKGPLSIRNDTTSVMSGQTRAEKPVTYGQAAALKKGVVKQQINEQKEVEETDPDENEGKIKLQGNAALLFD